MRFILIRLSIALMLCCVFTAPISVWANSLVPKSPSTISLNWPDGWELQPMTRDGNALHLSARQRLGRQVMQRVQITAVRADASPRPVTLATLYETVEKLSDAVAPTASEAQLRLRPFGTQQGFYFVMTDKHPTGQPNDFPQMMEGVVLSSGYLINITLLTYDMDSQAARSLLNALETMIVR